MGAALSIPFLAVPSITGIGGWVLSCCGAAAVTLFNHLLLMILVLNVVQGVWYLHLQHRHPYRLCHSLPLQLYGKAHMLHI